MAEVGSGEGALRAALGLALSLCWLPLALASPGTVGTALDEPKLRVFADSSLRDAFGELAAVYNRDYRADVAFTFVTPATSGERILGAAPINVFAGANPAQLEAVQRATGKVLGRPQVFGRSRTYQIAAYAEGPVWMQSLARDFVDLVIGRNGQAVLAKWGL